MNILPLKKWHVRRRENVERVRKDEAEARAKEEELQGRAEIAEREARLELMKKRARERDGLDSEEEEVSKKKTEEASTAPKNINFFTDLEQGVGVQLTNADHDAEKKAEQEKAEKRIGILNYLVDKDKTQEPWYSQTKSGEESAKSKQRKEAMDPMNVMKEYLTKKRKVDNLQSDTQTSSLKTIFPTPTSSGLLPAPGTSSQKELRKTSNSSPDKVLHTTLKHKHKKHKKGKRKSAGLKEELEAEKRSQLEKMRRERRKREEAERTRTESMLKGHYGSGEMSTVDDASNVVEKPGRYFSQFNPHLVRQHKTK